MRDQTVKYINHAGDQFILQGDGKAFFNIAQLYQYEWNYQTVNSVSGVGGDVLAFAHDPLALDLELRLRGFSRQGFIDKINTLHSIAEADTLAETPGTLYVGNQYTKCYLSVAGSVPSMARNGNFATEIIRILFTRPFWCTEKTYQFNIVSQEEEDHTGKKYNLRNPYRYGSGLAISNLINTHYSECPAIITIYGPTSNPSLQIAGNTYNVDVVVTGTERLVIDQTTREIYTINLNGARTNVFNKRNKEHDIIKPVPVGDSTVLYSGDFLMTITLVEQRSQLKWTE